MGGRAARERQYEEGRRQPAGNVEQELRSLQAEVDRQRKAKVERGCASCRPVSLQVDAATQSLLGSAGLVAGTLLREPNADRGDLLQAVLQYVEPVKHLDPELESLYQRATVALA